MFYRGPILRVLIGVLGVGALGRDKDSLVKVHGKHWVFTKVNEFLYCRIADGPCNMLK